MQVQTFKEKWITEQYNKIKAVVGNDFSDDLIYDLLKKHWDQRKEPEHTFMLTKDSVSTASVESMIDRFLNSNYILSAYGVLYKQPTEHVSIFNDVIWKVIKERKDIRKFIAKQKKEVGEEFMLNQFTRYNSKQKNRKIVVNAAYGVIASFISVFFNNGPLMASSQCSITKTGQTLTTIAISNIENWLENNISFMNVSDLLDYVVWSKNYYWKNKEINEKHLSKLKDINSEEFVDYLTSKLKEPKKVDINYLKLVTRRLNNMEIKSIYYRNNLPAIIEQDYWFTMTKLILEASVQIRENIKEEEKTEDDINKEKIYKKYMSELDDFVFHTTAIDFIHPQRYTRQFSETRDTVIISDTDSVFISVNKYLTNIKKYFHTDIIPERDLDLKITKIFIHISDRYIKYILDEYLDFMHVSDERKGDISMKSEFDYSKILVDGKKTYAGWKVGELSVPLGDESEIDVKGLSIKKSTVVKQLRENFSDILENNVLNTKRIDTLEILYKFDKIENDIRTNLHAGNTTYLQPASVSGDGSYDIPERMPAWRGVQIWNTIHPEQTIDLPGRVMQIRITPLTDYSYLQEEYPVVYERIKDIFENKVNLLGSKYDGNSKMKSTQKDVLDIICIPYQLEKIPEWIIPLIDVDLIVDRLMKPGQFILNAIGVSTPDDYVTNVVDRKIINQILI